MGVHTVLVCDVIGKEPDQVGSNDGEEQRLKSSAHLQMPKTQEDPAGVVSPRAGQTSCTVLVVQERCEEHDFTGLTSNSPDLSPINRSEPWRPHLRTSRT